MRIAIIGGGISGLTAAYYLCREHDVTLFEAADYVGGHTNTVEVNLDGETHSVDTGFIVYNRRTYPLFCRLLDELEIPTQPTSMSFSVRCERTGLEYAGNGLNGLFAQRSNIWNRGFHRLLRDILRFSRLASRLLEDPDDNITVGEFFAREHLSEEFLAHYFLPLGSAVWSCPRNRFMDFPVRFVAEFYRHHGMLNLRDRPAWRVIVGGSRNYVRKLIQPFQDKIRLRTPVEKVLRTPDGVQIFSETSGGESFDHVIFACHSDQALRILGGEASPPERELLSAFPYERNVAVLHTDTSVLPHSRRAWASWNYFLPENDPGKATVTYDMNILQRLDSRHVFCVTLNGEDRLDPRQMIARFTYHHPVFTTERSAAQARHAELIEHRRTSYCGAYWGNGFHEDGVRSAWTVCQELLASDATQPSRNDNHVPHANFAGMHSVNRRGFRHA